MLARAVTIALIALAAAGCRSQPKREQAGATTLASAVPAARSEKPQFIRWPRSELPLEQFVQRELELADTEGAKVMVYVGATWCEPCRFFHQAIERGELDRELASFRFLEFDLDQDAAPLKTAGYQSKYVPLLAVPDPDGRASGRMIEGSIKGPGAVRADLLPRLNQLLAEHRKSLPAQ